MPEQGRVSAAVPFAGAETWLAALCRYSIFRQLTCHPSKISLRKCYPLVEHVGLSSSFESSRGRLRNVCTQLALCSWLFSDIFDLDTTYGKWNMMNNLEATTTRRPDIADMSVIV